MSEKRSDFIDKIGGAPAAMWHGWRRQAVKTDFRGGPEATYLPDNSKPNVMILHGGGETNLCNLHHRKLAETMAKRLWEIHRVVSAIEPVAAVTDAISMGHSFPKEPRLSGMGYSLLSREIFASSVVQQVEINHADAVIIITGCDKTVAGAMLAASWLKHLPITLVHGGTIRAGCTLAGKQVEIETANEAVGMMAAGKNDKAEHDDILLRCLPSPGGCGMMATSNTLAVLSSTLGCAVFSSASTPAMDTDHVSIHPQKLAEAEEAADTVMEMFSSARALQDVITPTSFQNAAVMLHAIGGSTNAVIHLPAIAEGFGIDFGLEDIRRTSKTPVLLNLLPAGKYLMVDLFEREGGLPPLARYMVEQKLIDGSARNVTGKSLQEILAQAPLPTFPGKETDIIRPLDKPVKKRSSLCVASNDKTKPGTSPIAPQGCVFKLNANQVRLRGPARIFDFEDEAVEAVLSGKVVDGDIVVLRYQGVSVGCPELLRLTAALTGMGSDSRIAVLTDGRLSGVSRGTLVVHVEPEAWRGGPIALIEEGDTISLDGEEESLYVEVAPEEMEKRSQQWQPPAIDLPRGPLRIAAQIIRPLAEGAIWWPRESPRD